MAVSRPRGPRGRQRPSDGGNQRAVRSTPVVSVGFKIGGLLDCDRIPPVCGQNSAVGVLFSISLYSLVPPAERSLTVAAPTGHRSSPLSCRAPIDGLFTASLRTAAKAPAHANGSGPGRNRAFPRQASRAAPTRLLEPQTRSWHHPVRQRRTGWPLTRAAASTAIVCCHGAPIVAVQVAAIASKGDSINHGCRRNSNAP
jgi:hypothetical protein